MKSVSIIISIRNEEKFIEKSLGAILVQDYPADKMQIIIADGMSTDRTREIVTKLAQQYSEISLIIFDNPKKIVPTGLNIALKEATGEIIIRVDGHTVIASDYVRQCVGALERTGADNVGGKMTATGTNLFAKAVALATSSRFGVGGARFHYSDKEELVDTVYMGAWYRSVFDTVGEFDEELVRNQDDEFNYRIRAAGGKILLCPKIKSCYTVRSSPKALWMQYYQYGFWKVRVLQKQPRQMSMRQFVPPLFVMALFISALFLFFLPALAWGIPSLYLAVNVLLSFVLALQSRQKAAFFLPLAFIIIHLSYGIGFWHGLFYFWRYWQSVQRHE